MAIPRRASGFQGCGGDTVLLYDMDSEQGGDETTVFMVDGNLWSGM